MDDNLSAGFKGVRFVGRINCSVFSCIAKDITTDEVVITDERIEHIKSRHPNDFERYWCYMHDILINPDYILEDAKPDTALVLKSYSENNVRFRLVLRLHTSRDLPGRKNAVLTYQYMRETEYLRLIRNKKTLYKNPEM